MYRYFIMLLLTIKFVGLIFLLDIILKMRDFYLHYIKKKFMKEINTDILKCKWVLVTGCTSGIGWKLVE